MVDPSPDDVIPNSALAGLTLAAITCCNGAKITAQRFMVSERRALLRQPLLRSGAHWVNQPDLC